MLENYLKMIYRKLLRDKAFSFINIAGLSIGLACSVLILLYVMDEVSYDRFHEKRGQLYQLTCDRIEKEGEHEKFAIAAMVQGPAFKKAIPEIREFVRVNNKQAIVRKDNETFNEVITWADANFFSVFSFPLRSGDAKHVLSELHSVVLTEETAKKYFGSTDVIGKMIEVEINGNFEPFAVTGIANKPPQNSSIKFTMLLPFAYLEQVSPDNGWMWVSYPTFFVLNPGTDVKAVVAKMETVYQVQAKSEIGLNHLAGYDNRFVWGLMPFTQMHLNIEYQGAPEASNPVYSYILSGVAVFILLIACINFVNLSVAQSLKRSKEVGIRKVAGGLRSQLMWQFLGESLAICFICFLIAILLTQLALPFFNELINKKLSIGYLFDLPQAFGFIVLFLVTGLAAGFYPALVLSGFNPIEALYNRAAFCSKNYLAKSLVIVQFALATFLIISTLFVYAQFSYLTRTDLGYNDQNLLEFVVDKAIMDKPLMEICKTEFSKVAGVEKVAYHNIGKFGGKTQAGNKEFAAVYEHVDENYLPLLEAVIISGRNFSKSFPADSINSVLVNETFVKEAGWKDAVSKTIDYMNLPAWASRKVSVIGVVKDYHYASLKEKIKPQVFTMESALPLGMFLVKISPVNIPATILALQRTYHEFIPNHPFQYYFRDEENSRNYEAEYKWKEMISFGALLAIFISGIGLLGLTMLSTERRSKEIGIRKVLGASSVQIIILISRDFIQLIFISFLIAIPGAWYAINKWLDNFAYRINMSWWMFAIAGILAMGIALLTISFLAAKAALADPANILRIE